MESSDKEELLKLETKFGKEMDGREYKRKMQNYIKRRHVGVTSVIFWNFATP